MARQSRAAETGLIAITIEGGLIAPEQVQKIVRAEGTAKTAESYACPKGTTLGDEISRFFRIGQAIWRDYDKAEAKTIARTASFARELLSQCLGFADLAGPIDHIDGTRRYRLALEAKGGRVPVVVAAPVTGADAFSKSLPEFGDGEGGRPKRSPVGLLQDWLNANPSFYWGLVFAGDRLRIMRDNASLTRPAWIEADLGAIFRDEMFADFTAFWLLAHATRFGAEGAAASDCALEQWREAGLKQGVEARADLRKNVEEALKELGQGLVEANPTIVEQLNCGTLTMQVLFEELLRTVYRLIFLAVSEDRDLLHPRRTTLAARQLYADGYSFSFWRERSRRRVARDGHHDAWEAMKVTLASLEQGEELLGLPALGGLFASATTPVLSQSAIPNRRFLSALFCLGFIRKNGITHRINWRDLKTEELGSVYESLLEIRPSLSPAGQFELGTAKGNDRKTSSSYYTPDSLVECLLDSALDPVLDKAEAGGATAEQKVSAILALKVIDPACGSGHFLLGAARRMADRVAKLRNEDAGKEETQTALRDVVSRCIHGVDRNPMAVELAKVALWIESVSPGQPLGFLDANLRCGDALLGVFDLAALDEGIPDEAYTALAGDDKAAAKYYLKLNRDAKQGQGLLNFVGGGGALPPKRMAAGLGTIKSMPEETVGHVEKKRAAFEAWKADPARWNLAVACDLYMAAFLLPKVEVPASHLPGTVPTTAEVRQKLAGGSVYGPLEAVGVEAARAASTFHWPLEFPDVMVGDGGFDLVLGNPPWDTMSPDYKEFFSVYDPNIRHMSPNEQEVAYAELLANPEIAKSWRKHCANLYAAVHFIKLSGRYRLFAEGNLGKGDFNVYRMFVETALAATKKGCVTAQLVPEGLYNGANATAIRKELFFHFKLDMVAGFENTKGIWFPKIDTRMKFCLYVAWKGGRTDDFHAYFRVNTLEKLQEFKSANGLKIPVSVVAEFSPDALAVMEFAAQSEIDICARMYALYPKFGAEIEGVPYRHYMREVDMGTNRDLFSDGDEGLPVFEGRMIDAYDYRAKGYVSGRGRASVWDEYQFGAPQKSIQPQWRIVDSNIPEKLRDRITHYRPGFGDVASPTNQRALSAALIPPNMICGDKVPTVILSDDINDHLLWLGVANSIVMDFLVRKKVALKMSYTIMDSLPFPRKFELTPSSADIARRVCALCGVGAEMEEFRQQAMRVGILTSASDVIEEPDQRAIVAAEVDVLVARDVFRMKKDEMLYILDPDNILGKDCGVETFKALRNSELRAFNEFRTQRLIVEAWDRV